MIFVKHATEGEGIWEAVPADGTGGFMLAASSDALVLAAALLLLLLVHAGQEQHLFWTLWQKDASRSINSLFVSCWKLKYKLQSE